MFDLEAENQALTQGRHIETGVTIVIRHGTNEYEITPDVDHQTGETLAADFRKFVVERNARRNRFKH